MGRKNTKFRFPRNDPQPQDGGEGGYLFAYQKKLPLLELKALITTIVVGFSWYYIILPERLNKTIHLVFIVWFFFAMCSIHGMEKFNDNRFFIFFGVMTLAYIVFAAIYILHF
jgi:hypothetical protein